MSLTYPESRGNEGIRKAYQRGYRVRSDGALLNPQGVVVKGFCAGSRYLRFTYREAGQRYNVAVHRLAAYQRLGEAVFESGTNVRHRDDSPLNNQRRNLRLGTCQDNRLDVPAVERREAASVGGRVSRVLSKAQVRQTWTRIRQGWTYRTVAAELGVSVMVVQNILAGSTYCELRPLDADRLLRERGRYFTWQGRTQRLSAWERELGLRRGTLWARLKRHTFEEAIQLKEH